MALRTSFITMVMVEDEDAPRGFSVPLPGEPIIEWRDATGKPLAHLVIGADGRTVEIAYPDFDGATT